MTIRTLIIDDETIARQGLRRRLQHAADFVVVGECADAIEAQASIAALTPDLIFLDIRMPELSGLELLDRLPQRNPPHIIFVTAYDDYAVRAFDVHALDYLLKPIDDTRFSESLIRARSALAPGGTSGYGRRMSEALVRISQTLADSTQRSDRIAIPLADRVIIVKVGDVDWIEASGNYVSIHADRKEWLLRETITAMDARLAPFGFVRIHRSTLVNIERIAELRSLDSGDLAISLRDGTSLKLSRNYREALSHIFGKPS